MSVRTMGEKKKHGHLGSACDYNKGPMVFQSLIIACECTLSKDHFFLKLSFHISM